MPDACREFLAEQTQPGDICIECGEDDLSKIVGGYWICETCLGRYEGHSAGVSLWLLGALSLIVLTPLWIFAGISAWFAFIPICLIGMGATTLSAHGDSLDEVSPMRRPDY